MSIMSYRAIVSLDGYVNDASGRFDWAVPDGEVHAFVNDLERPIETYLYGRRLYETMAVWETWDTSDEPPVVQDYATLWRAASKVVYSRTLAGASTPRTRVERDFAAEEVAELKARSAGGISIGGPTLAANALAAGLVDEIGAFVVPVIVGGGTRFLPDGLRVDLTLLDEHRFANGFVFLRYGVSGHARGRRDPAAAEPAPGGGS